MKTLKKRIFLIGSGPSLKQFDMSLLKNETTIAMNRSYISYEKWGFDPTYYLIIDRRLINTLRKDIERLINETKIKQFFILESELIEPKNSDWLKNMKKKYPNKISVLKIDNNKQNTFPFEIYNTYDLNNKSVKFIANAGVCTLEVSHKMGYNEVILLGIDAKYLPASEIKKQGKDLNH